jgi:uncharacterized protein (TIGR02996 family)
MTEEQAFLKAICDSPNDLAPRLVYCDWLEEEYERRGPTPLGEICPKYQAVNIREQIAHGKAILDPLCNPHPESGMLRYHRNGFIELLYVSPADWAREADLITSHHPINQVVFSEQPLTPASYGSEDGCVTWQIGIGDKVAMIKSNRKLNAPPDSLQDMQAIESDLEPYQVLWPQISFHTISISSVTAESINLYPIARYDIYPWSDKPLGDLLQRHAELALRTQERPGRPFGIASENMRSHGRHIAMQREGEFWNRFLGTDEFTPRGPSNRPG